MNEIKTDDDLRDLSLLEDEIAELAAHIDAATYRLLTLIRELDQRGEWGLNGFVSCAHWLNYRIGLGMVAAREKVRVAHSLVELPLVSEALRKAEISYSKARAITRVASPETEQNLMQIAKHGTASHLEKVVRAYRKVRSTIDLEEELTVEAGRQEARFLTTHYDDDGMLVIRGKLSPEEGARLMKSLEAAERDLFEEERSGTDDSAESSRAIPTRPTHCQRRADALVRLADAATTADVPRDVAKVQVVLHVDAKVLADPAVHGRSELERGTNVSAESSRRMACDADVVLLTEDSEGNALDVGRKRRTIPPAIHRAMSNRDNGCRFPGCDRDRFLAGHHIEHWANGGATKLDNLVQLCSLHHRLVHEGGFRVERQPDGELQFVAPGGSDLPRVPRPLSLPPDILEVLEENHSRAGLTIKPTTGLTLWDGEGMDLSLVIQGLLDESGLIAPASDLNVGGGSPHFEPAADGTPKIKTSWHIRGKPPTLN